jgi:ADP-L-glycero-D-manno-heptose 6-epimerase
MILVTGAAGFIGSNVVAGLNDSGRTDVVVCDRLRDGDKWLNLRKRSFQDLVRPEEIDRFLAQRPALSALIHMGAISSTTARDGDEVMERNFRFSLKLLDWCTANGVPFVYASSAATYGEGELGFIDDNDPAQIGRLRPLNLYGWSKRSFDFVVADRATRGEPMPPRWAGFRFFNVFGPNEYHKGEMQSVVAKIYPKVANGEPVALFKSHRAGIADGDQRRDFVYVRDVVSVLLWSAGAAGRNGIFNIGTGTARSFRELAEGVFRSLGKEPRIEYVDMPESIRDRYQYYTAASLDHLRAAGYTAPMTSLEDGVGDYVTSYLSAEDRYR